MQIGREEIFTDYSVINELNIEEVMRLAMPIHEKNASKIDFLLNYEAGCQPLVRKEPKKYRPEIDCHCVDNVANEITEFKLGFIWGNPITLIQRGENDSGEKNESLAISLLNECYEAEKNKAKTQKLARFVEITGIGYTYIDINAEWKEGESYFKVETLDPRCTFLVRSNYYIDQRPVMAVTYRCDKKGNKYYTCFTKDSRYELNSSFEHLPYSGEMNPIGEIPVIEWIRSYDRMGCFERQISEMDNLNLLISDFTNDVESNTQAIWHGNDVEFPKVIVKNEDGTQTEEVVKPKGNDWMLTYTSQDGKTPTVKPLAIDYDYQGMLSNIISRRNLILQKCNIPNRVNDNSGSTGVAMDTASGYTTAESSASKQQNIMEASKMDEVKIALIAIKKNPRISNDNPMLKLNAIDIQPSIKRRKDFELTTKINFFATAVSHGVHGLHALKAMNAFEDVNQTWEDSKELIEMYQKSIFMKENQSVGGDGERKPNSDRISQDMSDQQENSPFMN